MTPVATSAVRRVSAYVPCFNNAATLRRAVEGVLAQTIAPAEVIVIDDGSTDDSVASLAGLPVRVLRHERNLGRGAVRARAMQEAAGEFVLCCDATNVLPRDFAAQAMRWFDEPEVAAVSGIFQRSAMSTAASRWRDRHLFKVDAVRVVSRGAVFSTSGAVVRRAAVEVSGGFDAALRHSEDAELGRRLLARGYAVVCDPSLGFVSISRNGVAQVLERYWRWHAGEDEAVTWRGYGRSVVYALKCMVRDDLRAGDWPSAAISFLCPHFQFWKSWLRARNRAKWR